MEFGQPDGYREAEEATVLGSLPRLTTLLPAVLVVACAAACTSGPGSGSPEPAGSSPGSSSPGSATPAGPPSVPMRVEVTHVAGRLAPPRRQALAATVGRTISTYVDAAFLAVDQPRSGVNGSFTTFTRDAARQARGDQALLTNRSLGAAARSVRATRRTAYLSVLAPEKHVAGVTAAVDLVFRVDPRQGPAQRVEVRGRLLLTRDRTGAWRIFGYDVARSQTSLPATTRPSDRTSEAGPSGAGS
jgi:hypothetical protein